MLRRHPHMPAHLALDDTVSHYRSSSANLLSEDVLKQELLRMTVQFLPV